MIFKKYDKVERWDHKDEIEGINIGEVYIQEKIDGANAQVFFHDGHICIGKRSDIVARINVEYDTLQVKEEFRGLPDYIFKDRKCYKNLFKYYPEWRLYGEWLVKHTVIYGDIFINKFYVFDIYDENEQRFLQPDDYFHILDQFYISFIPLFYKLENPSMDELLDLTRKIEKIPKSNFGAEMIEGLVYKNYDFINRYGRNVFMKAVTKEFLEVNKLVFTSKKDDLVETQIISKFLTPTRMEKVYQKMKDEHEILNIKYIPEFMNRCLHDLITEDCWDIMFRDKIIKRSKGILNVFELRNQCNLKSKNYFISRLQNEFETK